MREWKFVREADKQSVSRAQHRPPSSVPSSSLCGLSKVDLDWKEGERTNERLWVLLLSDEALNLDFYRFYGSSDGNRTEQTDVGCGSSFLFSGPMIRLMVSLSVGVVGWFRMESKSFPNIGL